MLKYYIDVSYIFLVLGLGIYCPSFAKSLALALDGFDLYTVHKLSSNEKTSRRSQDLNPRPLGAKRERGLPNCIQLSSIRQQ